MELTIDLEVISDLRLIRSRSHVLAINGYHDRQHICLQQFRGSSSSSLRQMALRLSRSAGVRRDQNRWST